MVSRIAILPARDSQCRWIVYCPRAASGRLSNRGAVSGKYASGWRDCVAGCGVPGVDRVAGGVRGADRRAEAFGQRAIDYTLSKLSLVLRAWFLVRPKSVVRGPFFVLVRRPWTV